MFESARCDQNTKECIVIRAYFKEGEIKSRIMGDSGVPSQAFDEKQDGDVQISMDYEGDPGNNDLPVLDDIEEDDEFEDFASQSWSKGKEESSDSYIWNSDWDEDDLRDDFARQLRAELMDASRNE